MSINVYKIGHSNHGKVYGQTKEKEMNNQISPSMIEHVVHKNST